MLNYKHFNLADWCGMSDSWPRPPPSAWALQPVFLLTCHVYHYSFREEEKKPNPQPQTKTFIKIFLSMRKITTTKKPHKHPCPPPKKTPHQTTNQPTTKTPQEYYKFMAIILNIWQIHSCWIYPSILSSWACVSNLNLKHFLSFRAVKQYFLIRSWQ